MIRDITIGQYYKEDSIVHKLDPRTKLIITFFYLISLFIKNNIFLYAFAFLFLMTCIYLCKVPLRYILRGTKTIAVLLLFTIVINMLLIKGTVFFRLGIITITYEGLFFAAYMAARLIMLVVGASILTLTTTPNNLTDGLERVFAPLKIFKVPVHEMAMMMSIALRFIPILLEETDRIMKAQMARCADFESGNIIRKVKSYIPVLIPLFTASFKRASDMAMAMEARCYQGGKGRTKMKPLKYKNIDFIAYFVMIIYFAGIIFLAQYGNQIMNFLL